MQGKVLIFVPAYNCAKQIVRVIAQLDAPWVRAAAGGAIILDNASTDNTYTVAKAEVALRADGFVRVLRNVENFGLGGSHKVAMAYAKAEGFDWLLVLHGDDQGSIDDFKPVLEGQLPDTCDAVLGARFLPDSKVPGYSKFRVFGNHVFNLIYTACLFYRVHDLGSGLNLFRLNAIPEEIEKAPDDLTFNCVLLAMLVKTRARMRFYPITWREDDQVSNVKLFRQSIRTLVIAIRALLDGPEFVYTEHRSKRLRTYPICLD